MLRFLPLFLLLALLTVTYSARNRLESAWQTWRLSGSSVIHELSSKEFVERIYVSGQFNPDAKTGTWFNKTVVPPNSLLTRVLSEKPLALVLGENSAEKWIDIDLTTQRLTAYEGNNPVYVFKTSTGLPWMPTVTGEFRIWAKVRSQRMTGGSVQNGTFYDLPNVPFVQYFYGGYGIHGTYWHNDFGKPRSHGCVNISIPDAQILFNWTTPPLPDDKWADYHVSADQSIRVNVHGTTPTNLN